MSPTSTRGTGSGPRLGPMAPLPRRCPGVIGGQPSRIGVCHLHDAGLRSCRAYRCVLDLVCILRSVSLISVALEAIGRQLKTYLIQRSSDRIDQHLSQLFFESAVAEDGSEPGSVGTLASQIRGYEVVRQYMTSSFLFLFADLPFAFIFLDLHVGPRGPYRDGYRLTLLPVGILLGLALRGPIERYTALNVEESNRRNGLLVEALDGAETMKSVGAEWEIGERWRSLTERVAHGDLKVKFFSYLAVNLSQLLQQLTYVGIVAAGSFLVSDGDLTVGALIACSILSGRALGALSQFPNVIVQGKQAKIALGGLDQMMSVPTDQSDGEPAALPGPLAGDLSCDRVGVWIRPRDHGAGRAIVPDRRRRACRRAWSVRVREDDPDAGPVWAISPIELGACF